MASGVAEEATECCSAGHGRSDPVAVVERGHAGVLVAELVGDDFERDAGVREQRRGGVSE